MKKTLCVTYLVVVLSALVLSACSGNSGGSTIKRQSPPADYANTTNPFEGQADAVTQGKDLYASNCATCHGEKADGNGPAGAALEPKPRNLELTAKEANAAYMHWVISEGGAAAGLSPTMVAYKGILSNDELWKIVTYLRGTYGK